MGQLALYYVFLVLLACAITNYIAGSEVELDVKQSLFAL
jgi:hypothetical protein